MKPKMILERNGDISWRLPNGLLHRDDGPAVITTNDNKKWYKNGEKHRVGGPAHIAHKGRFKVWFQNDKLHRVDGPALESPDGFLWCLNGIRYSEAEHKKIIRNAKIDKLLKD